MHKLLSNPITRQIELERYLRRAGSALETVYKHCPDADVLAIDIHYANGVRIQLCQGEHHIEQLATATNTQYKIDPYKEQEFMEINISGCTVLTLRPRREDS